MIKPSKSFAGILGGCWIALASGSAAGPNSSAPPWVDEQMASIRSARPILIVTTDIGGDPDDQQSMRRLLLYANEFDIRGLIASASGTPGELEHATTSPGLIHEIIDDYARVQSNLRGHDSAYPPADALRAIVASGSPERAVSDIGEEGSTEGSRLIVRTVEQADGPVNIAIWGGARDVAQALYDARAARPAAGLKRFVSKLRIHAIGDQDGRGGSRDGKRVDVPATGGWIRDNFPSVLYIETGTPATDRYSAVFRGMYQNDSTSGGNAPKPLVKPGVEALNNEKWVRENVNAGHGPLGAGYPLVRQNPRSPRNTIGVKEGDTPSWFYFLPLGLSDPDQPAWGGWGGRFRLDEGGDYFLDGEDIHWSDAADAAVRRKWTVARWRAAYQNDFAARMDWCVENRDGANHPPSLRVCRSGTLARVRLTADPGERLRIPAEGYDPDGDALSFGCWIYAEVTGANRKDLVIGNASKPPFEIDVKREAAGRQYHLIVEVSDAGVPSLTRYRRIIIDVAEDESVEK
ncbi:MAG: DUF1593 domain-containing protein [Opitutaceae bacterium]